MQRRAFASAYVDRARLRALQPPEQCDDREPTGKERPAWCRYAAHRDRRCKIAGGAGKRARRIGIARSIERRRRVRGEYVERDTLAIRDERMPALRRGPEPRATALDASVIDRQHDMRAVRLLYVRIVGEAAQHAAPIDACVA